MRYDEEITHSRGTFALFFSPFFSCHTLVVLHVGKKEKIHVVSRPEMIVATSGCPIAGNDGN